MTRAIFGYSVIICLFFLIASMGPWYIKFQNQIALHPLDLYYALKYNNPSQIPYPVIISLIFAVLSLKISPFFFSSKQDERYGQAKWGKPRLIPKMGLNVSEGIILGKLSGNLIRTNKPLSVLILAPPGTGKTSGIIIPTLLTCKNSMVIHDPKGELYQLTSHARSKFSTVLLFDPRSEESVTFNVFAKELLPEDSNDLHSYVYNVSTTLIRSNSNDKDKFFVDTARQMFTFIAEVLIHRNGETNISSIRNYFLSHEKFDSEIKTLCSDDTLPISIKRDGNGILTSSSSAQQWAGVTGTLNQALLVFADSRVEDATSGDCHFTEKILRKGCEDNRPVSVYIRVRDEDKEKLAPLISMVFQSLSQQFITHAVEENDYQVTYVIDEFVRLGKINELKDLPSIARSSNLNAIFVAQDYDQITETYGKEAVPILQTNCAYKIVFRQNSYQTAEEMSKLIGPTTVRRRTHTKSIDMAPNSKKSVSSNEEGIPFFSAQKVLNMKKKECIVIVEGFPERPLRCKIPFWFKNRKLKRLVKKI
jgi:type IV secretion system protein VirD4